jgi:hypothetical protein
LGAAGAHLRFPRDASCAGFRPRLDEHFLQPRSRLRSLTGFKFRHWVVARSIEMVERLFSQGIFRPVVVDPLLEVLHKLELV